MGFETGKDAKTNSNEIDGLLGTACLDCSVQEEFTWFVMHWQYQMRGEKGYGPGGLYHQGMSQQHTLSVAPGKTLESAVSAPCFLCCWAWASPHFPWREGLALCSEPGAQPGAHLPIPGETQSQGLVITLLSLLG